MGKDTSIIVFVCNEANGCSQSNEINIRVCPITPQQAQNASATILTEVILFPLFSLVLVLVENNLPIIFSSCLFVSLTVFSFLAIQADDCIAFDDLTCAIEKQQVVVDILTDCSDQV